MRRHWVIIGKSPQTLFWHPFDKRKVKKKHNYDKSTQKNQTFHNSGKTERSCTQVNPFKSSDSGDISEHCWRFLWTPRLPKPLQDVTDWKVEIVLCDTIAALLSPAILIRWCRNSLNVIEISKKKFKTLAFHLLPPCPHGSVGWLLPGEETNRAYKYRGSRSTKHVFGKQH